MFSSIRRIHDSQVNKNYALCRASYAVHFKTWLEFVVTIVAPDGIIRNQNESDEAKNKQHANRSTIIQMIAIQFSWHCRQVASS